MRLVVCLLLLTSLSAEEIESRFPMKVYGSPENTLMGFVKKGNPLEAPTAFNALLESGASSKTLVEAFTQLARTRMGSARQHPYWLPRRVLMKSLASWKNTRTTFERACNEGFVTRFNGAKVAALQGRCQNKKQRTTKRRKKG